MDTHCTRGVVKKRLKIFFPTTGDMTFELALFGSMWTKKLCKKTYGNSLLDLKACIELLWKLVVGFTVLEQYLTFGLWAPTFGLWLSHKSPDKTYLLSFASTFGLLSATFGLSPWLNALVSF